MTLTPADENPDIDSKYASTAAASVTPHCAIDARMPAW